MGWLWRRREKGLSRGLRFIQGLCSFQTWPKVVLERDRGLTNSGSRKLRDWYEKAGDVLNADAADEEEDDDEEEDEEDDEDEEVGEGSGGKWEGEVLECGERGLNA